MKTTDQVSDINGMPAKYITSGETSSQIKLDPDTNWIASAEITQVIEGEVEILPSENLPDGLKFPMVMEIQTTISNWPGCGKGFLVNRDGPSGTHIAHCSRVGLHKFC